MILNKVKEIVASKCSSDQKIKQIKDLFNCPEIKVGEAPYFDLLIEKENVVKFKQYIPEGKMVSRVEIISVKRLATTATNTEPHIAEFLPAQPLVFINPNIDRVVREHCLVQYSEATIEFTAIIGFNLKAMRFKIEWDQAVIPGTKDLPPYPTFLVRVHLEDK